jgi:hypothetical protein
MGGIVTRTDPKNCYLKESDSNSSELFELQSEKRISNILMDYSFARVRRHIYVEKSITSLQKLIDRLETSYHGLDINNPFAKRGLIMTEGVVHVFTEIFKELFFYENYDYYLCRNTLLLEAAFKIEAYKHNIIQSDLTSPETLFVLEKGKLLMSLNKKIIRRLIAPLTYKEWLIQVYFTIFI